jgi:hypothetical protein
VLYARIEVTAVRKVRLAEEEEEDLAAEVAEHGPAFPVPPLNLPHYHGIGVDPSASSTTVSSPDPSLAPRTEAGAAKEVTGA